MSRLASRLTQLRKQSGSQLQSARALVAKRKLAEKIQLAKAAEALSSSRVSEHGDTKDKMLATMLKGDVYKPGLIRIRSNIPLNALHQSYNATLNDDLNHIEAGLNSNKLLFIDTETTGLSTAAGTLVFLLGCGEIIGETFVLEQMLLTRVSAEPDLLHWFNCKLNEKSHLVSYNGKSFDAPLLMTRFRMNRIGSELLQKQHLDLLHWIRRLHKTQLTDCRLPSVEKHCLGFERQDDLPGSEAPEVWQQLIRFNRHDRLPAMIRHHAWDVNSLAGLLHYVESVLANHQQQIYDHRATASYLIAQQQTIKAKQLLEENRSLLNSEANYLLSQLYRREGQWEQAVAIWEQLSRQNFLPAIESLAKFYEHKSKDYLLAVKCTQQLVQLDKSNSHFKRLNRLEKKIISLP